MTKPAHMPPPDAAERRRAPPVLTYSVEQMPSDRQAGVEGAGPRWLELGAGEGAFTLALADLLGPGANITAVDRDAGALRNLARERFQGVKIETGAIIGREARQREHHLVDR